MGIDIPNLNNPPQDETEKKDDPAPLGSKPPVAKRKYTKRSAIWNHGGPRGFRKGKRKKLHLKDEPKTETTLYKDNGNGKLVTLDFFGFRCVKQDPGCNKIIMPLGVTNQAPFVVLEFTRAAKDPGKRGKNIFFVSAIKGPK